MGLLIPTSFALAAPVVIVATMAGSMAVACQAFEVGAIASFRASAARSAGGRHHVNTPCMRMRPLLGLPRQCRSPPPSQVPPTQLSLGGGIGSLHQRGFIRSYRAISGSNTFTSNTAIYNANAANTGSSSNDDDDVDTTGSASNDNNGPVTPTWTYVPYQPPKPGQQRQQRRRFSSNNGEWKVPNKITVPEDKLEISFVRSSGAGGQNVNKVNTKVEMRFLLDDARWIPAEVRSRIKQNEASRINKEGYLTVTSQEYRTQAQNRKDCLQKIEDIVLKAYPRPKVRKMRKGVSKAAKERKKQDKKHRSQTKANRKKVDF